MKVLFVTVCFMFALFSIVSAVISDLTRCKHRKCVITPDGSFVVITCCKCGSNERIPKQLFEDKVGMSVDTYLETKGMYITF